MCAVPVGPLDERDRRDVDAVRLEASRAASPPKASPPTAPRNADVATDARRRDRLVEALAAGRPCRTSCRTSSRRGAGKPRLPHHQIHVGAAEHDDALHHSRAPRRGPAPAAAAPRTRRARGSARSRPAARSRRRSRRPGSRSRGCASTRSRRANPEARSRARCRRARSATRRELHAVVAGGQGRHLGARRRPRGRASAASTSQRGASAGRARANDSVTIGLVKNEPALTESGSAASSTMPLEARSASTARRASSHGHPLPELDGERGGELRVARSASDHPPRIQVEFDREHDPGATALERARAVAELEVGGVEADHLAARVVEEVDRRPARRRAPGRRRRCSGSGAAPTVPGMPLRASMPGEAGRDGGGHQRVPAAPPPRRAPGRARPSASPAMSMPRVTTRRRCRRSRRRRRRRSSRRRAPASPRPSPTPSSAVATSSSRVVGSTQLVRRAADPQRGERREVGHRHASSRTTAWALPSTV